MKSDRERLEAAGFYIGPRNPNRNRAFKGKYMVAQSNPPDLVTDDARHGGFCVVGDDLDELIAHAALSLEIARED